MISAREYTFIPASVRQFHIETRRSIGLLAFPLMVAAGWFSFKGQLPNFALWPDISTSVPNAVLLLGPLAGGLVAWVAGRDSRSGAGDLLRSTAQASTKRSVLTFVGSALWGLLAYMLVVGGVMAWGYLDATWGGPYWQPILVGLLAVVAYSAIGFAFGSWMPGRFTAPLVAVLLFVAQALPGYTGSSVAYLAPLPPNGDTVFYGPRHLIGGDSALWLLGLTCTALAAGLMRHGRRPALLATLAVGVVLGTVGAVGLLRTDIDPPLPAAIPYEPVCVQKTIPICVHPAFQKILPRVTSIIDSEVEPFAGMPGAPRRAEQVQAMPTDLEMLQGGTIPFRLAGASHIDWVYEAVAQNTAHMLTTDPDYVPQMTRNRPQGGQECGNKRCRNYYADGGGQTVQWIVEAWLLQRSGLQPTYGSGYFPDQGWDQGLGPEAKAAFKRFSSLDPKVRHRWFVKHYKALREGRLTLEDMP